MTVILVDVDGVLADFTGHLSKETGIPEDAFTAFKFEDCLTPEQTELCRDVLARPGFCSTIPAYKGAKSFVKNLKKLGEVVAVTAPWHSCTTWEWERRGWLKNLGIGRMISAKAEDKHLIQGEYLIEDRIDTLECWRGGGRFPILLDRPWNRTEIFTPRLHSYREIVDYIKA
jgi:5'(3')-deoxyribonucleotidase